MTAEMIREQADPMVIWMADAAIRGARRAILGNDVFCRYPKDTPNWNKPEVEMAAEVLFRMLNCCIADVKTALINMPVEYDGFLNQERTYFDAFVMTLGGKTNWAQLRESDWCLERL